MSERKNGRKPDGKPGEKKESSTWGGCLLVLAVFVLPVAIPVLWGLWDEGAFDPDLSQDVKAVALGPAETSRLVERLQEASRTQGVCYGWEVDADTAAPPEIGSNLGVGVDVRTRPAECPSWVVLRADYFYSSIDKEWSSVGYSLEADSSRAQLTSADLSRHGVVSSSGVGDRAVAELADAIGAMPLMTAERDRLPVPAQEQRLDPSATVDDDELASTHGAGWWSLIGLGALLIGLGLLWIIRGAVKERKRKAS